MLRGLYTSSSGMLPRVAGQAVAANNLANVNTTGFKRDVLFRSALLNAQLSIDDSQGRLGDMTRVQRTITDFAQGDLKKTDRDLDVALMGGNAFFVVETPDGPRYTRNGNFTMNADGELVTSSGHRVLGEGGPIEIVGRKVVIDQKGEVSVNGVPVDRLAIVGFDDLGQLKKIGDGLFRTDAPERPAERVIVRQGFLEGSNVKAVLEMVDMITFKQRIYESNQRSISYQDETLDKAANDLGRVK